MVAETAQASQSIDYVNLGTNLGILIGFIVAAVLGIKKGLKTFAKSGDAALKASGASVAAATILENQTLAMWSESNREVADALALVAEQMERLTFTIRDHEKMMVSHKDALYVNRDNMVALRPEFSDLRHQIERLRDAIDRDQRLRS